MGKKSKKKGGGGAASKAARKEKLQERREQQLEQLDHHNSDDTNRRVREYFKWDRVWFMGDCMRHDNPNTYRGIVQSVDGEFVVVKPLQSLIDGSDYTERILTVGDFDYHVFPDFCDMTLRFDVGDNVLCCVLQPGPGGYVSATVDDLWPIGELKSLPSSAEDMVPHYRCSKEFDDESENDRVAAPADTDNCIKSRPTSFRLKVGDDVTFNTAMAGGNSAAASNYLRRNSETSWIRGKVTNVDRCAAGRSYASYECSFQVGAKSYSCSIWEDDDEHIALADTDPRKRLFDAIEQDCSRLHFIYLTTHFKIDVATFRDLVVMKAIEFASYDALAWLENDCKFSFKGVTDEDGNNFLHMIAKSPFASRFIKKAGKMEGCYGEEYVKVTMSDFGFRPSKELNNNGEIWLQILVLRGDVKALDAAFSPHHGLGYATWLFGHNELQLVGDSITGANNRIMECIFSAYTFFRNSYTQFKALVYSSAKTEEELFGEQTELAIFTGDGAEEAAKRLTRFYYDWKGNPTKELNTDVFKFIHLAQKGWFHLFRSLYEADRSVFEADCATHSNADKQQFIHKELRDKAASKYELQEEVTVDIFHACILGKQDKVQLYHRDGGFNNYAWSVLDHYTSCMHKTSDQTCQSLHQHLSQINEKREDKYHDNCTSYRLRLLEDENDVEGRRRILEYLLEKHTDVPLDALLALKHRQGWALRFMVEKKHLDLDNRAAADRNFSKNASTFSFLDSGRIPSAMTTRCFLCFAAVQFDDMQSLEWLCESSGPPTDLVGGWNLLHYSAYMGRIEIIGWLSTLPVWDSLVSQPCQRKPFHGAFAVHIAASCGHIHVCDLLITLNVQLEDKKGKLPEDYAKKARHEFVRKWAADRAKPQALEKNIKKLFHLIEEKGCASQQIKDFITASKCLEIDTWKSCDYYTFDTNGPMGLSFGKVLHRCCENLDIQLATWLCIRYYFHESSYRCGRFWGRKDQEEIIILSRDDLVSFADERGYDELASKLRRPWFKSVSCRDPLTVNLILESALGGNEHLGDVRATILRIDALFQVIRVSEKSMKDILQRGGRVDAVEELLSIHSSAVKAVSGELGDACKDEESYRSDVNYFLDPITIGSFYLRATKKVDPVSNIILWREDSLERDPEFLAAQGYTELLQFCLTNLPGWTATLELNIVRIASFFGHSTMVEMLLCPTRADMLRSDFKDRRIAAILGAGQALRYNDLVSFTTMYGAIQDSIKGKGRDEEENCEEKLQVIDSLLYAVITGYVEEQYDDEVDNKETLRALTYLVEHLSYTHDDILYVVGRVLDRRGYIPGRLLSVIDLLWSIIDKLGLQPACNLKQIQKICMIMVKESRDMKSGELLSRVLEFIGRMANTGMDIQAFDEEQPFHRENELNKKLTELQQKQVSDWSQFDLIKKGGSLADIQQVIEDGALAISSRDRGGLLLTHLSAAYDRLDLLEWLVVNKGMDLDLVDGQRRTTLDVAKASKAAAATKWIMEWKANATLQTFLRRNFYRARNKRRMQRLNRAAVVVQSNIRGYATRKIYASVLMSRMEESQRFMPVWGHVIASLNSNTMAPTSWVGIREQLIDIKVGLDDEVLDETDQKLNRAMEGAVSNEVDDLISNDECSEGVELEEDDEGITEAMHDDANTNQQWLSFQMTSHVVKFLQQGDKKYRSFFVRRMRQLAAGERSRILQKPLKGSKSIIYETYLEQKSGHRILWTEELDGKIVIWYVAKHKQVSRLMQLIDDSKSRSVRQQMPQALISELQDESYTPPMNEPRKEVLLDIFNNVPLKIYDVNFNTINEIAKESWTPKLHLTDEERDIVEAEGTVLVLGRSGTGKTICICNRIEYDRQTGSGQDPLFTQLFVARSVRLCRYVEGAVGEDNRTSFTTYERLLSDIESTLPTGQTKHFNPSQRMDFSRFRRDFHSQSSSKEKVGALISWTVIRTFLKGSIEAFQSSDGILPKDDFVEVERLGKNRCRLPSELRELVYDEFLRYQKYIEDQQLWDDCDRVRHILLRIKETREVDPDTYEQIQRSKVYVDEVQDYTQLEILLFFYLGGPNGLFLAGDPAQSVVEGTEFRFEEIRSCGHFVGSVLQKPKTVNVNFRSHSGILNCAGGVLDFMFTHFPGSAKQLKKDAGLFQGSRPGVFSGASIKQLNILLSDKLKGAVILTHDDSARHWRRLLNDYKVSFMCLRLQRVLLLLLSHVCLLLFSFQLVYGIREAKGLEFKTVIILDFFREILPSLQKPWRELVLGRAGQDFERSCPQVGTYLKLLYTGVTRCIEKLFFVETRSSTAGDATMRWLTKKESHGGIALATRNNINDVEAMSMTSDEFVSEGINNAELAQTAEDLSQAQLLLERAIWCFEQSENIELASKARIHSSSVQFRAELQPPYDEKNTNDCAMIEMRAAQLTESLTREGFFFETVNIFSSVEPFLSDYTKEELGKRFIRKVRLLSEE
jgi:hypothetical protein